MRVALTERLQRDARALAPEQRDALLDVILALPAGLADVHRHAGLGVRKLHASGIWEARVGLGVRVVFTRAEDTLTLVRAGTHDDIRRFLKTL